MIGEAMIKIDNCAIDLGVSADEKVIFELPEFSVSKAEQLALIGPSGCGKSTLINVAVGLLSPISGSVIVNGTDLGSLTPRQLDSFRGANMGIIYQNLNLLKGFTALENILIGMRFGRTIKQSIRHDKALALLDRVGLKKRVNSKIDTLSGGELQRVAVARAIANDPALIIADEPTGSLDPKTADCVFNLIREIALENNCTLLFVTHDHLLADKMDRIFDCRELIKHKPE